MVGKHKVCSVKITLTLEEWEKASHAAGEILSSKFFSINPLSPVLLQISEKFKITSCNCQFCGKEIACVIGAPGRTRMYCSDRCRTSGYRKRKRTERE